MDHNSQICLSLHHLLHRLVDLLELDAEVVLVEITACQHHILGLLLWVDVLLLGDAEPILPLRLVVPQGWEIGRPLERILLLTIPMLETRCAAAGGVLVRKRLRT